MYAEGVNWIYRAFLSLGIVWDLHRDRNRGGVEIKTCMGSRHSSIARIQVTASVSATGTNPDEEEPTAPVPFEFTE